jgi:hypothetical protein
MSRVFKSAGWAAGVGLVPLLVVLWLLPGRRGLAVDLFFLLVAAGAVLALVRALSEAAPRAEPEPPPGPRRLLQRLPELERTERAVLLAASNAFDVHYRLRPILREIAGQRLATRRGLALDRDTSASRAVVGEATWELVRPDREPPHLRFGPGVGARELAEVVDSLERI